MKTKNTTSLEKLFTLLTVAIIFSACQKDIRNDEAASQSEQYNNQTSTLQKDNADVATDWYNLQLRFILQANPAISPLAVNRFFGYTGISLLEAARFEISNSISLNKQLKEMPVMPVPESNKNYAWVASANAAMANITRYLFPALTTAQNASIDSLEKVYNNKLALTVDADAITRSKVFGDTVAARIFNWSKSDLFNHANDPYAPPAGPGLWVPAPPLYLPAAGPYAGNCRPFLAVHGHGTAIKPPYNYSEEKGSDFYAMANYLYKTSKTLTDDQKNIAFFWNDAGVGVGYTPMGHNISIINQILKNSNATLAKAEQVYVKAGVAMWDASTVCWRSKYKYNQLRPVTYIKKVIDSTWLPLIITPNHPEYPAAHAFITSSVMEVLTSVFGNHYSFTDHTYDFRGFAPRSYTSFEKAANECGQSRVYGGIHYQQSVDIGHLYGQLIGKDVAALELTK